MDSDAEENGNSTIEEEFLFFLKKTLAHHRVV
jgi:hypothetical protein